MKKKIIIELDINDLDESIKEEQIKSIAIVYYNIGEDDIWQEEVPFKILKWYNDIELLKE
uniref:Uncharacterized protein n=1 Tax=viral metagenome TaxID=1070528 RepID=A0A6M3XGF0_9ZZZZ